MAQDRYAYGLTGCRLVEVRRHWARCQLTITPEHLNAMGSIMGGALFTLADYALAAAMNSDSIIDGTPLQWVSTESHIHYLHAASQGTIEATAECIHQGRLTCLYRITLKDDQGRLLAACDASGLKITN